MPLTDQIKRNHLKGVVTRDGAGGIWTLWQSWRHWRFGRIAPEHVWLRDYVPPPREPRNRKSRS